MTTNCSLIMPINTRIETFRPAMSYKSMDTLQYLLFLISKHLIYQLTIVLNTKALDSGPVSTAWTETFSSVLFCYCTDVISALCHLCCNLDMQRHLPWAHCNCPVSAKICSLNHLNMLL